ncbi:testis-expressed protein 12 [Cygnus atratus]|uniref:testis-expressed protein 12 n=1 Tax=Cygnus atratus TaxID=8868 RepID=UPI0021B76944|nr:testis-expressed protein 12 [Cygnus atratus]
MYEKSPVLQLGPSGLVTRKRPLLQTAMPPVTDKASTVPLPGTTTQCLRVTMTSNTQKSDENRSKRKKEMEVSTTENPQLSSTDKTDVSFSEGLQSLYKPEPLEEVLNEMNKEIKNLLSKYAHILSERAAMDASYVQELDGILKEARTLENHLKQKRESLKQRFTVIANTLQS